MASKKDQAAADDVALRESLGTDTPTYAEVVTEGDSDNEFVVTNDPENPHESGRDDFSDLPQAEVKADQEVAQRSQDTLVPASDVHEKLFTVRRLEWEGITADPAFEKAQHEANLNQTRQALIHQGLRPTGDGEFAGTQPYRDDKDVVVLRYTVPCTPAVAEEAKGLTDVHVDPRDEGRLDNVRLMGSVSVVAEDAKIARVPDADELAAHNAGDPNLSGTTEVPPHGKPVAETKAETAAKDKGE